jgi:hypothetical protein
MRERQFKGLVGAALLLSVFLSGCLGRSDQSYAGITEDASTIDGVPSSSGKALVEAFGNTGANIQQLIVRVDTRWTYDIHSVTAFDEVDETIIALDFREGALYIPRLTVKPQEIVRSGSTTYWNVGYLPHGYRAVVVLYIRRLPLVRPMKQHELDTMWCAAASANEPVKEFQAITGTRDAMG